MSFQTTDSKKEEFRKYLEKAGVIDQLTRVLVGLYEEPEKPGNAIEYYLSLISYVKKYLGSPVDIDVDKLKLEYEKLKDENIRLKREIGDLKKEVRIFIISVISCLIRTELIYAIYNSN